MFLWYRLSKVAGDKLRENNPNIADLSDQDRPTKLAELYSELYDNTWTDAFEILTKVDKKSSDRNAIDFLLESLMVTLFLQKTNNYVKLIWSTTSSEISNVLNKNS